MDKAYSKFEKRLYDKNEAPLTVEQLIARLKELPQNQEIVIYPKYDYVDSRHLYRFKKENVSECCTPEGYEYISIIF